VVKKGLCDAAQGGGSVELVQKHAHHAARLLVKDLKGPAVDFMQGLHKHIRSVRLSEE
jgi:hypothetical protein